MPDLLQQLRSSGGDSPDDVLGVFIDWLGQRGTVLYPAQEEALLAVLAGEHVIVGTPTGSGKTLVALGAHLAALAAGGRSFYTAPIKALVSEKFFDLCSQLGSAQVGMMTGDASINPEAPVICCTAEVLANIALRHGDAAPVDQVVMDEFHYYADRERGWAWQVPLIELRRAQMVLMSATLGDVTRFVDALKRRTGRPVSVVTSAERPIPLEYRYARTLVHDTIDELAAEGLTPIYAVHFTQKAAVERAQALASASLSTRPEREAIAKALAGYRFSTGFGHVLARLVRNGVGVHHAGMLPKYRRLVERLCQDGLLKVVCGTDTLGVGINMPIRTVLFTALSKYDGSQSRLLTAREFHQMAGRAGRAGFDTAGTVVAQAPEHVAENERAQAKAEARPGPKRKVVKAKPPKGFINWDEGTFQRLRTAQPEALASNFKVSHAMLLEVLDRPGDGCAAMKRLLTDNDDPRPAQRYHIRQAIAMYRSMVSAGVLERLDEPGPDGRRVRVTVSLQDDFALNHPLSLFVLEAVPRLETTSEQWDLDVVSVVESTLEGPWPILAAQLEALRAETLARLKAEGMEYEERMEVLRDLEHPKPLADFLYDVFDAYRARHPWARDHNVQPKSIVRDMYDRAMSFSEYVAHYKLARSEGLLLRYLADAYKSLDRNVPVASKSPGLVDITAWVGEMVRQVDSSLLDEWEMLSHPAEVEQALALGRRPVPRPDDAGPPPLSANARALRVMVRNACFRRVEMAALRQWDMLGDLDGAGPADAARWSEALTPYYAEHTGIGTGPDARGPGLFQLDEQPQPAAGGRRWRARQVLDDPEGYHEWALVFDIDIDASDAAGLPILSLVGLERQ